MVIEAIGNAIVISIMPTVRDRRRAGMPSAPIQFPATRPLAPFRACVIVSCARRFPVSLYPLVLVPSRVPVPKTSYPHEPGTSNRNGLVSRRRGRIVYNNNRGRIGHYNSRRRSAYGNTDIDRLRGSLNGNKRYRGKSDCRGSAKNTFHTDLQTMFSRPVYK